MTMAKFKRTNNESLTYGTGFSFMCVVATPKQLEKTFGKPQEEVDGVRTTKEWWFVSDDGQIFTLYDYKVGHTLKDNEEIMWHIGSKPDASIKIVDDFKTFVEEKIK